MEKTQKEYLQDLSAENIHNLVQYNEIYAADLINEFAEESEIIDGEINLIKEQINSLKSKIESLETRKTNLFNAAHKVRQHLNKPCPLLVKRKSRVVILTSLDLIIDRNAI